jgi:hypothetical protein
MMQHTPGPWVVKADEEIVYGTSHEGERIVVVYELNSNEADAALIAAAPDLLAALREIKAKASNATFVYITACKALDALEQP